MSLKVRNYNTDAGEIATYSGEIFKPLEPEVDRIHIEDIAHALANSCRFTGHVSKFYSTAQHSVCVSLLVPPELAFTGLLHDASEAYLSDISRPVKNQPEFGDVYRKFENRLEAAVAERFNLVFPFPPEIKWADLVMLRSEQRDLMPTIFREEGEDYWPDTIEPWSPEESEDRFLERFWELV